MTTLTLDHKYINILQALGNLEELLEDAVRHYTLVRVGERVGQLQREIHFFQKKYGLSFEQFYERITEDELFISQLRQIEPMWERDLNIWEYDCEELTEWLGHLENISKPSSR